MAISISNYPVYLQDGLKLDRDCLKSQESQNEGRKVFDRDSLEVSPLSKNREILMDRIKHTVVQSAASLSDMRAGILKEIREEKGQYAVIPHFIYFQIHCTSVKFNKAPVSNKLTFIASDSLIPGRCMLS